jgi:hypothetical protein
LTIIIGLSSLAGLRFARVLRGLGERLGLVLVTTAEEEEVALGLLGLDTTTGEIEGAANVSVGRCTYGAKILSLSESDTATNTALLRFLVSTLLKLGCSSSDSEAILLSPESDSVTEESESDESNS